MIGFACLFKGHAWEDQYEFPACIRTYLCTDSAMTRPPDKILAWATMRQCTRCGSLRRRPGRLEGER